MPQNFRATTRAIQECIWQGVEKPHAYSPNNLRFSIDCNGMPSYNRSQRNAIYYACCQRMSLI